MEVELTLKVTPGTNTTMSKVTLLCGNTIVFAEYDHRLTPAQREVVSQILFAQSRRMGSLAQAFEKIGAK